jgi:hypothetical protein
MCTKFNIEEKQNQNHEIEVRVKSEKWNINIATWKNKVVAMLHQSSLKLDEKLEARLAWLVTNSAHLEFCIKLSLGFSSVL